MSKSKVPIERVASNILPSEPSQDADPAPSISNWESLFKTHIGLAEAHVSMLNRLMEDMDGERKEESRVLDGMKDRANGILEDARRAGDILGRTARRASVEDEKKVDGSSSNESASRTTGFMGDQVEGRKRKADSVAPENEFKVSKRERSTTHTSANTSTPNTEQSQKKSKRKASSEYPSDTPKPTKKERLTPTPALTSTSSSQQPPQSSSRKIKTPKSPRKPIPETTLATTIDFTSLHDQLQAEIQAGLKLQAEKLVEEERLRERNGEKKKRKRERDSFGFEEGKGGVVGERDRKKMANGEDGSDAGIVVPVGNDGQRKKRSQG